MNSGLNGIPSHFSRPNNLVGQTLDLRQRWGDATLRTPPIFANIENKTSHASQLLLDLQVDSASKFKVDKAGVQTLPDGTASAVSLRFTGGTAGTGLYRDAVYVSNVTISGGAIPSLTVGGGSAGMVSNGILMWGNQVNTFVSNTWDAGLKRGAAGILQVTTGENSNGGALQFKEQTAPAGAATMARIYAVDNAGKTELRVIFETGGAVTIAAEP